MRDGVRPDGTEPLGYKEQIPLHQAYRNRLADGAEDAQSRDLSYGFLAPALLLFRLERGVVHGY